jgi:hypothetical protein
MQLDEELEQRLLLGWQRSGAADGAGQIMAALRGGTFEIQRADDTALARFTIAGGKISPDGDWTIDFAAADVTATGSGRAEKAVMRDASGKVRISGLTVGMPPGSYDAMIDNTHIPIGCVVSMAATVLSFPMPRHRAGT